MAEAVPAAQGVYKPRRPKASPLFRLVSDHLHGLQTVYEDRFAREYGPWRPVVAQVADKFLACGVLEHGFARIRCRRLCPRIPVGLLLQVPVLLPELSRQALGDLDAVAGHHTARTRAASASRPHDPETTARLLFVSSPPPRRDRPRGRPHGHGRDPL